jgi:dCMP deaminase
MKEFIERLKLLGTFSTPGVAYSAEEWDRQSKLLNKELKKKLPLGPTSKKPIDTGVDKWDKRFLGLAQHVSTWSRDPSTQCGAVIIRPDKSIASEGFNGFPRKMADEPEWYENREEKYSRIIHAEMNAVGFCKDDNLTGYTLYTYPMMPCNRCFVHMVQWGITRFVYPKANEDAMSRWGESFEKVLKYADECKVEMVEIEISNIKKNWSWG